MMKKIEIADCGKETSVKYFTLDEIEDIVMEDVSMTDYPELCDAYISEATYMGRRMTEEEIEFLNDNYRGFVYDCAYNSLF